MIEVDIQLFAEVNTIAAILVDTSIYEGKVVVNGFIHGSVTLVGTLYFGLDGLKRYLRWFFLDWWPL